ncbi:MAG: hypothetical protein H7293_17280 [Candidatus Saccharibacteria bacterium]|nr:hypothetical protein [Rhodoferax sp.]
MSIEAGEVHALERGERSVKHFYLDRAHQLQGRIGLSLYDLEQRLRIEDAFRACQ